MASSFGLLLIAQTGTTRFAVYSGNKDCTVEHGLGARALTSDFKGKYHCVFSDNYFTSLNFLENLEKDPAKKRFQRCSSKLSERQGCVGVCVSKLGWVDGAGTRK